MSRTTTSPRLLIQVRQLGLAHLLPPITQYDRRLFLTFAPESQEPDEQQEPETMFYPVGYGPSY
jgi:hypothetical protein